MNDREQIAALGAHMTSKRKDVIDERLLLQATPALLDGWCGPVEVDGRETVVDRGRVLDFADWEPAEDFIAGVWLDLSRAECRDRVARVVAAVLGVPLAERGALWMHQGAGIWGLFCGSRSFLFKGKPDRRFSPNNPTWVKNLDSLDPEDDTRLPDGSRLVDALALAIVAREVAAR